MSEEKKKIQMYDKVCFKYMKVKIKLLFKGLRRIDLLKKYY